MEAAGLGLARLGYPESLEQAKGVPGVHQGLLATGKGEGAGEMSGLKRAFMGLRAAIGNFNGFWGLLPSPPAG